MCLTQKADAFFFSQKMLGEAYLKQKLGVFPYHATLVSVNNIKQPTPKSFTAEEKSTFDELQSLEFCAGQSDESVFWVLRGIINFFMYL